jgi:hypothetical protein
MPQITYEPGTQSGPFSQREMDGFAEIMSILEPRFVLDQDYAGFVQSRNGGAPVERYFRLKNGDVLPIERILNFSDFDTADESDLLFHVHEAWGDIQDRLSPGMFPFATLPGGDFLVFDASGRVALWYHERSTPGRPYTEVVASGFAEFAASLSTTTSWQ